MKKKTIKLKNAIRFILARGGKFFSVKFVKRTTGEERTMCCRRGVKKYLAKNPKCEGLDFKSYGLISVFDKDAPLPKKCTDKNRKKGDYRCIPGDNITAIMIDEVWYAVK